MTAKKSSDPAVVVPSDELQQTAAAAGRQAVHDAAKTAQADTPPADQS